MATAVAAALVLAISVPPSSEATRDAETLSAAQMFDFSDRLAKDGRTAEAENVLEALAGDPNIDIRSEARFRIGLIRERRRDWSGAARSYRAILDEKPLSGPVRLQLARVLVEMGDEEAARRQLRFASSVGLPEQVTRLVNQFQDALRSRRRLGGSIELGFAPDSNINRAQQGSTVEIGSVPLKLSEDAQAQSGVGLTISSQGYWRPHLVGGLNLLVTLNGSANIYRKNHFNDVSAFTSSGLELLRGRSRFRLLGVGGRRWFGQQVYSTSYGVAFNWLAPIDGKSQAQLDITAVQNNHRINPALTGLFLSSVVHYERALSPRLFGRISLRLDRQGARDPAFATWSGGGEVLLSREAGPLTLYGRAGYYHTRADETFSFPGERRNDRLLDLEAGLSLHKLNYGGLSPVVRLHRTSNRSPVFFYDFDQTRVEFALTREF